MTCSLSVSKESNHAQASCSKAALSTHYIVSSSSSLLLVASRAPPSYLRFRLICQSLKALMPGFLITRATCSSTLCCHASPGVSPIKCAARQWSSSPPPLQSRHQQLLADTTREWPQAASVPCILQLAYCMPPQASRTDISRTPHTHHIDTSHSRVQHLWQARPQPEGSKGSL